MSGYYNMTQLCNTLHIHWFSLQQWRYQTGWRDKPLWGESWSVLGWTMANCVWWHLGINWCRGCVQATWIPA